MDVDVEENRYMALFDLSPSSFPFRSPVPSEIERRRASLSDVLIFDILLSLGGIQIPEAHAIYPPSDPASLRTLLDAIETSSYDTLKKDSLVYFLLKWHRDTREEEFAQSRCIPPQFVKLADAYWHLDVGVNVSKAISLLADSRLNPDHVSKVIQVIGLSPSSSSLLVRYIRTARPPLTEPNDINAYVCALAESATGLLDAWQFQRTFPEHSATRERVLRVLIEWSITPKPRPNALAQLLAFPFTSYEQSILHAYALSPPESCPQSSISIIQDLACTRLIQGGRYADAIKLDRQIHPKDTERRRTMGDLLSTMPTVERRQLEEELKGIASGKAARIAVVEESSRARRRSNINGNVSIIPSTPKAPTVVPMIPTPQSAKAPSSIPLSAPIPTPMPKKLFVSSSPARTPQRSSPAGSKPVEAIASPVPTPSAAAPVLSANRVPNAFYTPPAVSNTPPAAFANVYSAPKSRLEEISAAAAGDMAMDSEDEVVLGLRPAADESDVPEDGLGFSVFGGAPPATATSAVGPAPISTASAPTAVTVTAPAMSPSISSHSANQNTFASPKQMKRSETLAKMPPGAFFDNDEGASGNINTAHHAPSPPRSSFLMPPPPPPQVTTDEGQASPPSHSQSVSAEGKSVRRSTRKSAASSAATRTSVATTSASTSASVSTSASASARRPRQGLNIPGGLAHSDEEDDGDAAAVNEEDDELAPLPPSPTLTRRRGGRTSKSSNNNNNDEQPQTRRRSSRLSVTSSSPDPPSPTATTRRRSSRVSSVQAAAAGVTSTPVKKTRSKKRS